MMWGLSLMKTVGVVVSFSLITLAAGAAHAQNQPSNPLPPDVGRVLAATPLVQSVQVPRQVCATEQVVVPAPRSGAGALMGALAGGALGNAVGGGAGRAAATAIGVMGGAMLGERVEGGGSQIQQVQQCSTQLFTEQRTVGYSVVYEYAGRQYTVQMPSDPGPTVQLQVTPVGMSTAPAASVAPVFTSVSPVVGQTVITTQQQVPQVVYVPAPPPVRYIGQPYPYRVPSYPPVSLQLGWGWHEHRHHRPW
jgi:uncharacterized protein YcfJ